MDYLLDGSGRIRKAKRLFCTSCGQEFLKELRFVNEEGNNFCCRTCSSDFSRDRVKVTCSYCKDSFEKTRSSLRNSLSGFYFCCRTCKDMGQRLEEGLDFMWPEHYGTGKPSYREKALEAYGEVCYICSYAAYVEGLEVHHIDRDRANNKLDNLVVLCCTCHKLVTRKIFSI